MSSTLNALRGNHLPYERQRILDGIPQVRVRVRVRVRVIDGIPQVSLATLRLNAADPCPPLHPTPTPTLTPTPTPTPTPNLTLTLLLHRSSSTS